MKVYRLELADGTITWAHSTDECRFEQLKGEWPELTPTGYVITPSRLLAPIQPVVIYCIGLNFHEHAAEIGIELPQYPVLFMKAPSAICGTGDAIQLPRNLASEKVDWEVELAIIIGRKGKNILREHALEYVYGYTVANDVSARDWQKHAGGGQWIRAKTFDTFCPIGPCIVTRDELPQPNSLKLKTSVNGEIKQNSTTADFIFPIEQIISYVSGSTTLYPGTVILTGTPSGVGMGQKPMQFLNPGDEVTCTIEAIGSLTNSVIEEPL